MGKLWHKEAALDELMEKFTVGNDYVVDIDLVAADVLGSIAHARTLFKASLLDEKELQQLELSLAQILKLHAQGMFVITRDHEDCHTAIEGYLTKEIGQVGKKIHTGRSRNDQVQTALRLWMREYVVLLGQTTLQLAQNLLHFASEHEFVPMPGRTHMQLAMPSTVGLWAASYAEELLDEVRHLHSLYLLVDQSPLGSAASYGTPLPLDRQFSATELGFSKVQNNVLYANNSRGKFEAMILDGCDYITLTLSKLAQDLLLFTLPELGYFSLPEFLCTGSSIMPQKKNPDGLELVRSKSVLVSSASSQVKSIIRSLPSGYNRDFQDTKEPFLQGCKTALLTIEVTIRMVEQLQVNPEALLKGFSGEIYATDEVLKRLESGGSFRDIYKDVGLHLDAVSAYDAHEVVKNRSSQGTSGNLGLPKILADAHVLQRSFEAYQQALQTTYAKLNKGTLTLIRH